jgi:uncharacterized protein with PIN domain
MLDGMLGSLTRWLRICGYEAVYHGNSPDDELIERSLKGGFVLLTRDELLYRKGQRAGVESLLVRGEGDVERLAAVSRQYDLTLEPSQSRCPSCGASLREATKEALRDIVPPRTFEAYEDFWLCDSCGKAYWRGSHWRNIVATVAEASRRAGPSATGSEQDL